MWNKMDREDVPEFEQVSEFVGNPLFDEFCGYVASQYAAKPNFEYSGCSVPGWNIKYKKAGKSLCTVYPMAGYFIVLIVIGNKEREPFERRFAGFTPYLQELYQQTKEGMGQRWLMIEVKDESIIGDLKTCIAIRRGLKEGEGA